VLLLLLLLLLLVCSAWRTCCLVLRCWEMHLAARSGAAAWQTCSAL
jgi:hypothetical protein